MLELAEATGNSEVINLITKQLSSHPMKDKSFHYIPYKTDSDFEQKFLAEVLTEDCIKSHDLEVYYNGDLTEKDRIVQTANAVERFFTEE